MDKLILAPIKGYTDSLWRKTYLEYFTGIDGVVTPFLILSEENRVKKTFFPPLLPELELGINVTPQFLVKKGNMLIEAASMMADLGVNEFNLNMGCPSPSIYKKGRGAGLLENSGAIESLLDYVVPRIPGDLTVKIRTGITDSRNVCNTINILNNYPLKEVIVHPRFARQLYNGCPDLEAFSYVYNNSNNPVAYNGDVNTLEDYLEIKKMFPNLSSVMIGRGVLMDPFLPSIIKTGISPKNEDRKHITYNFIKALDSIFLGSYPNPKTAFSRMKSLLIYISKSLGDFDDNLIKRSQTLDEILEILSLN